MKKILILLLINIVLFANNNYKLKLYEKVLTSIFQTSTLVVYADSSSKKFLDNSSVLHLALNCKDATLLIGKKFNKLDKDCYNKPVFATSYKALRDISNSFGAFYWRKGRPQIKFNSSVIKEFNLYLPDSLKRYAK